MGLAAAAPRTGLYEFKPGRYSSHTLLLNSLPADGQGRSVLDLGCAAGYLSARLAERGYEVIAVDRPGAFAQDSSYGVDVIEADLDDGLPPLPGGFDYVLCADVLEHLRDPRRMLREVAGMLAPGGALVASLPNSGNAYFRACVLLGRFPQHDRGLFDRTHVHFFTWSGWNELFASAGFRVQSVVPTAVPFSLALPGWPGTHALEAASFTLARLWKTLLAYQFVVIAGLEQG